MLTEYLNKQLDKARYELLEDGTYYGEIPGLRGVWSNAKKLENCRKELREVLEGWLILKLRDRDPISGLKTDPSDFTVQKDFAKNIKHAS